MKVSESIKYDDMVVSPWGFDMHLSVELYPSEPQADDSPGWPACADIYEVRVGGINIYEMLTKAQLDRLEAAALRAEDIL
jgi:hypothetical protein